MRNTVLAPADAFGKQNRAFQPVTRTRALIATSALARVSQAPARGISRGSRTHSSRAARGP